MTAFALLPEAAIMDVALLMAPNTGRGRLDPVAVVRLLMAIEALGLLVRTVYLVLGAPVMVEIPGFPVALVVAAIALLA